MVEMPCVMSAAGVRCLAQGVSMSPPVAAFMQVKPPLLQLLRHWYVT